MSIIKNKVENIRPMRKLVIGLKKTGGRNVNGWITAFHRGGGHKRQYRLIDYKRNVINIPARVLTIEHDPNRSALIGLVCYTNGILSYIILPTGVNVGDFIINDNKVNYGNRISKIGSAFKLKDLNVGDFVHNIELYPGKGGQIARSAGAYAVIMKISEKGNFVFLKLQSGEIRMFLGDCMCTYGQVSNVEHRYKKLRKAGESRWLGKRPIVRGVAMNPVDHPHGGGEGKTSGGRFPSTPWGRLTKGPKTRSVRKNSNMIIKRRK